ncbi:LOW QUALITY PROTEIN: uncharacterized protein CXorf65 homolog [Nyctibius grandis]|uniref:LOW QUALITY PROTEIN: uncharacterized protein CXorf65 homolog n=1 Tax=Nyctibius grandis TaxID=48427 RepID=UPI0035BBA6ED
MFIYIKHGSASPPGHPLGASCLGMEGTLCGLAGQSAWPQLCGHCLGCLLPSATAALPADDQSSLANTSCAVLRLLSYLRRMVGVPDTDVIDLCEELGIPKTLFQVTSLGERAREFLQARGTYCVCRVGSGAPGTKEEHTCWSFTPLLEYPSPALREVLRLQGKRLHRRQTSAPEMPRERTLDMEMLPSMVQGQGAAEQRQRGPGTRQLHPPERVRGRASGTGSAEAP